MANLNKIQSGIAGVYLAAAELTRKGYITSITSRNTKGIDVLVSNETMTKSIGIQVKTNQGTQKKWLLNANAEHYHSENLFYIFVNLNDGGRADFRIAPSKTVAAFIRNNHKKWLATPGRNNQKHIDTPMRAFIVNGKLYLNDWKSLGL